MCWPSLWYQLAPEPQRAALLSFITADRLPDPSAALTPALGVPGYDHELRRVLGHDVRIDYVPTGAIQPDPRTGKARDFLDLTPEVPTP